MHSGSLRPPLVPSPTPRSTLRVLARSGPTQLQVPCHGVVVPLARCAPHPEQDLYPAPVLGVLRPLFSQRERGLACGHGIRAS